jgi:hypothetical protein
VSRRAAQFTVFLDLIADNLRMSLSALVKFATPVRARIAADLPRPRLNLKAQLLVPPRALNLPLIGTAFDYLFRFNLARRFPFAISRQWVAETALRLVNRLADADALLDDLLLDVKTTRTLKIRTEDWRQLLAYAALNVHFPIGGGRKRRIRRIGFYYSRHGYLVSWPLAEVVDSMQFARFADWLRKYAVGLHTQRLARRARANKKALPK